LCVLGDARDPSLDPAKCNFDQGSLPVVGSDGTLFVVFNNGNTPGQINQHLLVRCPASRDCTQSASWEGPFKIADDFATQPRTCPDAPGRRCLPPNSFRINDFPAMALDRGTGALYVVWADFRNGGPCAKDAAGRNIEPCANHSNDVFVARSLDGGTTWTDAQRVKQDDSLAAQVYPWVGVGDNGTVFVGYYDRRYGMCETFGCLDFVLSRSTDGGATWGDRRITTSSMQGPEGIGTEAGFLGDYNGLAADRQGAVMVWADTRGLYGQVEEDVYFSAVGP
jgi:hypothetical protein